MRPDDLARLDLAIPFDLQDGKRRWLSALEEAQAFVAARPEDELGCLYWSPVRARFEAPREATSTDQQGLVLHFGRPGGVVPQAVEG